MAGEILELDARRRAAQTTLQELQARRNEASKEIGKAKREGRDADALMAEVAGLKDRIQQTEEEERATGATLDGFLVSLPNLPAADVPDGPDETANVELRRIGEPPRINTALEHFDLGEKLGMMDFAAGAKLSGARFTVLRGKLARLERALGQFMLDLHVTEHGFTEVMPPLLVRDEAAFRTCSAPTPATG
jgi:seryl-tRNA synthetase